MVTLDGEPICVDGRFVTMPDEGALEFGEFYVLSVKFTDDFRIPLIIEEAKLFRKIHFFQNGLLTFRAKPSR